MARSYRAMLDDLLGRTELKERISDLEAEIDQLEERYEAESERRASAVTARQEAEQRCNRLEDRIAQLEGELEQAGGGERRHEPRRRVRLYGERLEAVLDRLRSVRTDPEGALTCYIEDEVPDAAADLLDERTRVVAERAPCLLCLDDAALIAVVLEPPVEPAVETSWADRFRLEQSWFRPTGRHAVALVRSDIFAVGVYDGTDRVRVESFESDVKGDHSKGGFSQDRFERRRDEQIADHRAAVVETLADLAVDPLYVVGQDELVRAVSDELSVQATATVDATGDPEAALEDAVETFWTANLVVV